MNTASSPLIAKLRRETAARGADPVAVSVYETQDAHWSANYSSRPYVAAGSPLDWKKAKPAVEEAWYQVRDLAKSPTAHTPGDH